MEARKSLAAGFIAGAAVVGGTDAYALAIPISPLLALEIKEFVFGFVVGVVVTLAAIAFAARSPMIPDQALNALLGQ